MTYDEKKKIYEDIIWEVAKVVKSFLNESRLESSYTLSKEKANEFLSKWFQNHISVTDIDRSDSIYFVELKTGSMFKRVETSWQYRISNELTSALYNHEHIGLCFGEYYKMKDDYWYNRYDFYEFDSQLLNKANLVVIDKIIKWEKDLKRKERCIEFKNKLILITKQQNEKLAELNEKGIMIGGAKITNAVDDAKKYKKISEITNDTETHYVSNYGESYKLIDMLCKYDLLEEDHKSSAVLYPDGKFGKLTYWLTFSDMSVLCRFLVGFNDIIEQYAYKKIHDGKWHLAFDIHDDPMTGVENKTVTFLLEYKSKTDNLKEINDAIDDLCEKIEDYWKN